MAWPSARKWRGRGTGAAFEHLEHRRLMSGAWGTVDSKPLSSGLDYVTAMTADGAGNVYAAGAYNDLSGDPSVVNTAVLREKPTGSSSFVDVPVHPGSTGGYGEFDSVAIDKRGDLFLGADNFSNAQILERPAGQSDFAPVNVVLPTGAKSFWQFSNPQAFATDSAGDVFLIGWSYIATGTTGHGGNTRTVYSTYGTVWEMAADQSAFTPIYDAPDPSFDPRAITLIDSGPSAGMYITSGSSTTGWTVRKSTNGGLSWNTVDSFLIDPNDPSNTVAEGIASDTSGNGNVVVTGYGQQRTVSGFKTVRVNGKWLQQPVYSYTNYWLTRQSSDGGASWTTVDNVQTASTPSAIADLNGTVYVAGGSGGAASDAIVRTNAGGNWQTADDYVTSFDWYTAVTIDPTTGTPYAGTGDSWTIRSGPAPEAMTSTATLFSTTTVPNSTELRELLCGSI